jgi:hypothetical protein
MPNDPLVARLAADLKPVRPRSLRRDATILAMVCAIELALFLGLGMMRPDMPMAVELPSLWWKFTSLGLIALVGGAVALVSFDPLRSPRRGLRWLVGIVAASLASGWLLDASSSGPAALVARLDWPDGLQCVTKMVLLSLPAVAGLGVLMRRGAPTDTGGTALAAGVAASAWGAFVFVFACPYDDPLYIAVWYAVGCGLVTLLARLLLPPLTSW